MNKDMLVGIGAIIAPVILILASLTYVSKPAVLGHEMSASNLGMLAKDLPNGHKQSTLLKPNSVR